MALALAHDSQLTSTTARWVAVYVRISRDRNGRAENVDTQMELATAYAAQLWPGVPVQVYCDNDLSAADPGTYRPEYARLLGDLAAGRVVQVVSADQDRLTRQPSEWEGLMPVLLGAGICETHGYRDGVTSVEPGKRSFGRFKALMGAEYVEGLKVKITEKLDKLARQGRPHGAATFGYRRAVNDVGEKVIVPDETEAEIVRWLAAEVLDGRPLSALADELTERGVTGARGGAMTASGVRSIVSNATIAGFRVHHGEIIGKGTWEPILDEGTWRAVRAKVAAAARKGDRLAARKYLLSGLVFCAECGHRMAGQLKASGREGTKKPYYQCKTKGCGIGISGVPVEELVADRLLARLDKLADLRNAVAGTDEHEARRAEITRELGTFQDRRAEAGRMFADGEIGPAELAGAKRRFDEREAALNAELADLPAPTDAVDPDAVRHAWQGFELSDDIEGRRDLLGLFIDRVTITRGAPGKRRLDLSRVGIEGPGWD